MTGIWLFFAMIGSASASSRLGTATRTMSQPDAVSSAICCSVALMFVVGVVVIDCTLTWASPPTSTLPTLIWRDLRRGASTSGTLGIPRFTAGTVPVYVARPRRPPSAAASAPAPSVATPSASSPSFACSRRILRPSSTSSCSFFAAFSLLRVSLRRELDVLLGLDAGLQLPPSLELGVELGAEQQCAVGEPEPEQEHDRRPPNEPYVRS